MKLLEFCNLHFKSRTDSAKAFGISYFQLNNMIARGATIEQLKTGEWITIHKHTKRIKI